MRLLACLLLGLGLGGALAPIASAAGYDAAVVQLPPAGPEAPLMGTVVWSVAGRDGNMELNAHADIEGLTADLKFTQVGGRVGQGHLLTVDLVVPQAMGGGSVDVLASTLRLRLRGSTWVPFYVNPRVTGRGRFAIAFQQGEVISTLLESAEAIEFTVTYSNGRSSTLTIDTGRTGNDAFRRVAMAWRLRPPAPLADETPVARLAPQDVQRFEPVQRVEPERIERQEPRIARQQPAVQQQPERQEAPQQQEQGVRQRPPRLAARPDAAQERPQVRVALVIGNRQYRTLTALATPTADAAAVAGALRANGFVVSDYYDLDRAGFLDALEAFGRAASQADVAVVYYAGHGMEVGGRNILAPVDMEVSCEPAQATRAVPVDALFDAVRGAPKQVVMLDACRNDPFPACRQRGSGAGSGFRGLALAEGGDDRELIVASSALSGKLASDGAPGAAHSPFAAALLARFESDADRPIFDVLNGTSRDVRRGSDGAQIPEISIRGGAPAFCLADGPQCQADE